ncbi:uncharacterized protein LOC11176028 [Anopheles gambiae]|uniref:uncharacterized protein LOC11176028 n=1 Tax=Anopheles gambiae TaxID=7165 RepID=UPI002AC8A965|nr:uncharacterized protein LOC11176028 [Anopheles gambiae]XP_061507720.1 uncharacterized protein LOC11176028 [Anopheles gambiae]
MPPAASSGRRGNGTAAPAHQQRKGKGGGGGSGGTVVKGEGSGAARAPQDLDEDTNAGFGKYLRSQEGIEMMKLFVIANTIVVFVTMAWPQMQQSYRILRSLLFSDEDDDAGEL